MALGDYAPTPRPYSPIAGLQPRTDLKHPLTRDEIREYNTKGFIIIRGRFSQEETQAWRDEVDALIDGADRNGHNLRYWQPGDNSDATTTPWKVDPCVDVSPLMARLARDRRITDAVASIYGGYTPRLFKDKLIIKPAGTHGNGLHQDYNWWQGFPTSLLSVSVAIDKTTRENGCTEFWTGHHAGFRHVAGQQVPAMDATGMDQEEHVYAELEPGDMGIFTCFTPHAAGPNHSDSTRRAIFLSYNDARDGEHYAAHYEHFYGYLMQNRSAEERAEYYWA